MACGARMPMRYLTRTERWPADSRGPKRMFLSSAIMSLTMTSMGLIVYHHIVYPALMAWVGWRAPARPLPLHDHDLPHITVVMPAYNEARMIQRKIENLAAMDYPADRLSILVGCDGSSDGTHILAAESSQSLPDTRVRIIRHSENRGKVSVLNDLIPLAEGEIVVLTDVSALLPQDAARRIAAHFQDTNVGAVGAGYRFSAGEGGSGESFYWRYQTAVKRGEARIGGLIGAHGACYAIRRKLFEILEADTINDDFMIPMRIGLMGYRTLYDSEIAVEEAEVTSDEPEFRRRIRIGAGNMQQTLRLLPRLNPDLAGMAFVFLSGKVLRVAMPLILAASLVGSLVLAKDIPLIFIAAVVQVALISLAGISACIPRHLRPALLDMVFYFVSGHIASGLGTLGYFFFRRGPSWGLNRRTPREQFVSPTAAVAKRTFDVLGSLVGLIITGALFPFIALAIKLESSGPVFFQQLRVGRALCDRTLLFEMIKFRSMRSDAETSTGPVWAREKDPRITRVGRLLRLTRLDELPQFINVLRGEMSLIGPRPERPSFYQRLEEAIPYYAERTYGLRPGISGLAQVEQGYDQSIEDVRSKVMFDHAYAISISRFADWFKTDVSIVGRTLLVMALGRGH